MTREKSQQDTDEVQDDEQCGMALERRGFLKATGTVIGTATVGGTGLSLSTRNVRADTHNHGFIPQNVARGMLYGAGTLAAGPLGGLATYGITQHFDGANEDGSYTNEQKRDVHRTLYANIAEAKVFQNAFENERVSTFERAKNLAYVEGSRAIIKAMNNQSGVATAKQRMREAVQEFFAKIQRTQVEVFDGVALGTVRQIVDAILTYEMDETFTAHDGDPVMFARMTGPSNLMDTSDTSDWLWSDKVSYSGNYSDHSVDISKNIMYADDAVLDALQVDYMTEQLVTGESIEVPLRLNATDVSGILYQDAYDSTSTGTSIQLWPDGPKEVAQSGQDDIYHFVVAGYDDTVDNLVFTPTAGLAVAFYQAEKLYKEAVKQLDTFADDYYNNFEPGAHNPDDMMSATELFDRYDFSKTSPQALSTLFMSQLGVPVKMDSQVILTEHTASGDVEREGVLASQANPTYSSEDRQDGTWYRGETYDPANYTEIINLIDTNGNTLEITNKFTINKLFEYSEKDGGMVETTTYTPTKHTTDYDGLSIDDLKDLINTNTEATKEADNVTVINKGSGPVISDDALDRLAAYGLGGALIAGGIYYFTNRNGGSGGSLNVNLGSSLGRDGGKSGRKRGGKK